MTRRKYFEKTISDLKSCRDLFGDESFRRIEIRRHTAKDEKRKRTIREQWITVAAAESGFFIEFLIVNFVLPEISSSFQNFWNIGKELKKERYWQAIEEPFNGSCPARCQFPVVDVDGKTLFTTPSPTQTCWAQHLHKKRPDYKAEVLRTMCQKPNPAGDKGPTEEMLLRYSLCPTMYLWSMDLYWRPDFETSYGKIYEQTADIMPTPTAETRWMREWESTPSQVQELLKNQHFSKLAIVIPSTAPVNAKEHLEATIATIPEAVEILLVAAPAKDATPDTLNHIVQLMDGMERSIGTFHIVLPSEKVHEMQGQTL
ncbi:unnamed protein product [Caenorhabditis brenneri]